MLITDEWQYNNNKEYFEDKLVSWIRSFISNDIHKKLPIKHDVFLVLQTKTVISKATFFSKVVSTKIVTITSAMELSNN